MELRSQIKWTMALGILSLLAGLLSHLALTDIYHAEENLSLEWNVLRISALVLVLFIGSSLFTLGKALKRL